MNDVSAPAAGSEPAVPPKPPLWRRLLPLLIGAGLVAFVLGRIDFAKFVEALGATHYLGFFGFTLAFVLALLTADSAATAYAYRSVCPVTFGEIFIIRGASYLPSAINHNVGQAWLTYFISKTYDAPLWRVAGATLFVYATSFATLVLFGILGLPFNYDTMPWLLPVIIVLVVAGLLYLVVIGVGPQFLRKRQATAPLVDAGLRGHAMGVLTRLPHICIQFLGAWIPFRFFDVDIPFTAALALCPVLMLIVVLPITPQGVGTRDVIALQLFAGYAAGGQEHGEAAVAAATLSWAVGITLVQLIMSPLFMRRAYRLLEAS